MTTSDRAADVIRNHGTDTCQEPECIAQDLADADLLAPDLPEPDEHGKSGQFHMAEWLPLGTGLENPIVWTAAGAGRVMIQRIEPGELNPNETHKVALALLAAANYAEQTKTHRTT